MMNMDSRPVDGWTERTQHIDDSTCLEGGNLGKILFRELPIEDVFHIVKIGSSIIAIIDVIGVLPHVYTEKRE